MASSLDWGHLKVLVVDDNAYFRQVVRTVLNAAGVGLIAEAASADEAMGILRDGPRDLILVDYVMPPMDGVAFSRQVRDPSVSPSPDIPIILVSGHIQPAEVRTALNAGINGVVAKPISARTLLREIRRTLLTDAEADPDPET